jgi:hypothetical protein
MCKEIEWVFTQCDPRYCLRRAQATKPYQVQPCEAFAHGNPPFRASYAILGLPHCQGGNLERREVPSKCPRCYAAVVDREKAAGRKPLEWEDYIKTMTDAMDVPEDFVWYIRQTPYLDPLFRAVDWNPNPRQVPLDSGEVSPKSQSTFTNTPAGVLNAQYDPRDWQPVDEDRDIVLLRVPDDLPIAYWPRPRKPLGDYTGPVSKLPIQVEGTRSWRGFVYCENARGKILETYGPKPVARHPPNYVPKHKTFEGKWDPPTSPKQPRLKPNGQPYPTWKP